MFSIECNKITLTRGDTLLAKIKIIKNGSEYTPDPEDVIRFALKHAAMTPGQKQFVDANPLVTKTIDNQDLILELAPADTKQLDFGKYKYDIQITFADGSVDTFVPDADFTIAPEVA